MDQAEYLGRSVGNSGVLKEFRCNDSHHKGRKRGRSPEKAHQESSGKASCLLRTEANRVTYSLGTLHYNLRRQLSGTLERGECQSFISAGVDGSASLLNTRLNSGNSGLSLCDEQIRIILLSSSTRRRSCHSTISAKTALERKPRHSDRLIGQTLAFCGVSGFGWSLIARRVDIT